MASAMFSRPVEREVRADHDGGAGRARVDAPVDAVEALEVAREVGRPGQEKMRKRHGLGVLAEAVAGEDRVRVLPREPDQHAPQPVDALEDPQHLLPLERVDPDRGEIARAAPEVEAPADVLAERADQVLLARVKAAARLGPHLLDAVLFHAAERLQDGPAVLAPEQALLDQHDGLRLVEGVDRVEHEARAAGGQPAQLGKHLFAEPDAAGAETAVLG
jgi:hypothetical protein